MSIQYSKPHLRIQSLLYRAYQSGATNADVSIYKDHIMYSDSTPHSEILDLTHLDPDYLYTVAYSIDKYPVPDKFKATVINNVKGLCGINDLGKLVLLPKIDNHEMKIAPRFTSDSKFKVHLCERPYNIDGLIIVNSDGTVYADNTYSHMSANYVENIEPGAKISNKRYQIIAVYNSAADNKSPTIETKANDVDDAMRLGYEMFVDYMNFQNAKGDSGYYWSTSSVHDKYIADSVLTKSPLPLNEFTQFHIDHLAEPKTYHTRFLLPKKSAAPRSGWSVNNSLWVGMNSLPDTDDRKYNLVTYCHPTRDHAEPDATVPIIWVTKASITWADSTTSVINMPVYVGDFNLLDQIFDDDLKNIITNVSAIELEVSVKEPGQEIKTFWIPTSMLSDDGRKLILVTSDFNLDQAELNELSGIHRIGHVPYITSFRNILSDWYYDYTLSRLLDKETETLNNDFLTNLVNALDEVLVDSDNWDNTVRVASDSGNVVIYASN